MIKRVLPCFAVLLALVLSISGCSGGGYDSSRPAEQEAATAAADDSYWEEWYEEDFAAFGEDGDPTSLPLLTPSNSQGARMVYNVNMQLETTTFTQGTRLLLTTVEEMGGYVQNTYVEGRSLRSPYLERYARYTLRIPSEHLASFLLAMETEYNLLRLEQESQNVAVQYSEAGSRLEELGDQEARLLEALANGELETDERPLLEQELARVQADMSALRAASSRMDDAVLYSTVSIQLYEVILEDDLHEEPATPFGERLGDTANSSWNGFVAFCQGLLLVLIRLLPVLVVVAVGCAIALVVLRILRKRGIIDESPKNKKEPPDTDDSIK